MPTSNDDSQETTKTIDDIYHRQRDITSNNTIQANIQSVLYNRKTKNLEFIAEINNFTVQLGADITDTTDTTKQFIDNVLTTDGKITIPDLPFSLSVQFNDDLTEATHEGTNHTLTIIDADPNEIPPKGEYIANVNKISTIIEEESLKIHYNEVSGDKPGHKAKITHITDIEGNDFTITIQPTDHTEKEFNITIDSLESMVNTPLQTLIENQGGGSPTMLDDQGEAILIHSSDVDKNLETIQHTQNIEEKWEITAPQTHAEWTPITPELESQEETDSRDSYTQPNLHKQKEAKEDIRRAGRYAALSFGIKVINGFYIDMLQIEPAEGSVARFAIDVITNAGPLISNIFLVFSMIFLIIGIGKYFGKIE